MKRRLLLAALLAATPALCQDGTFTTELSGAGAYEGGSTDEPLVVASGAPASGFSFRADEIERSLALSGIRLLRPAHDDGVTPFALLAFVARVPSVRADVSLASRSDDSTGTSTGQTVSITSSLTGDRTTRGAGVFGEWFVLHATSVRGGIAGVWTRETDATKQLESPSGRGDLATLALRTSAGRATFGLAQRLGSGEGLDAEVAVDGTYGWRTYRRHDELLFSEGGFRSSTYELGSTSRAVALSARALVSRRVLVEGRGSYAASGGALTQDGAQKIDRQFAIVRALSASATYYPSRRLGVSAGGAYGTETDSGGLVSEQRTQAVKTVSWSGGVRFFVTDRASLSATFARALKTTLLPPEGTTFQRIEETTNRVELAGAVRF